MNKNFDEDKKQQQKYIHIPTMIKDENWKCEVHYIFWILELKIKCMVHSYK